MTAKLGKVEIYNKGSPSIKSFDTLSTQLIDQEIYFNFHETYGYQTRQTGGF